MADQQLDLKLEESFVEESTVSSSNINATSEEDKDNVEDKSADEEHSEEDKENVEDKSADEEHSEEDKENIADKFADEEHSEDDKENIADKSADEEHSEEDKKEDEVSSGKRIRKKVDRLSSSTPSQRVNKREISFSGSGSALAEIEFIEFKITKAKKDELKVLHNIVFKKLGTALTIRKNLRKFNGFNFSSEEGDLEKTKTRERIAKLHKRELTLICDILGLEKSGNNPQVTDRIFEFLICPTDKGKKIPVKKSKKISKKKNKTAKKAKKAAKEPASEEKVSASEEESDVNDSEEEEEKEKSPSPKKAPKATPKAPKATPKVSKATPKAPKATPKTQKATPKASESKKRTRVMVDDDSSDDDLPLAKKMKPLPPTNTEIEKFLSKYMKSVDLEEVSMRQIIQKVYDLYPDFDITERKDFIKSTVKDLIASDQ